VIAVAPQLFDPAFAERLDDHLRTLERLGVHIPGRTGTAAEGFSLPVSLVERIASFAVGKAPATGKA
jgi:hypothetical protein